jgi:glycosyltransferase involved in cell wall biosynthesis
VLTLATPENIEVVGEAGVPYIDEFDLAEKLQRVLRDGSLVQAFRNRAQQRIQSHYDWDTVVDQYEQLFAGMSGQTFEPDPPVAAESEAAEVIHK